MTPLLNAAGREIPTARCGCGRHREASKDRCCSLCGTGQHTVACAMRQEHFPDTKRGVGWGYVTGVVSLRETPRGITYATVCRNDKEAL